jgi:hypothetical protein
VTLLYAQSPRVAASVRPTAPTINASQIGMRFFARSQFSTRTSTGG